ncbi:MAG: UDP-N-acetylglucosamine 2-epimerase [Streptosporangiaceae bacterium]|jgi:UDP-N-acetylglucosamine 2-epimerase (non-hydrolysing)
MVDTLLANADRAAAAAPAVLAGLGLEPGRYGLVTLHRPANVDDPAVLPALLPALAEVSRVCPLVLPVHPRTAGRLAGAGLPGLTLRDNTERPITVTEGTNQLVGRDPERIVKAARAVLDAPPSAPGQTRRPALWDGRAGQRIAATLVTGHHRAQPAGAGNSDNRPADRLKR